MGSAKIDESQPSRTHGRQVARTGNRRKPGFVRIIGGEWRGRRLPICDLPGLRPTGDRAKETLFNWLQPYLHGAVCVDLFAGTGALGLEACSRGAAEVTLVESTPLAVQALRTALVALQVSGQRAGLYLEETDALAWLQARAPQSLDIVFIDPPFGSRLEVQALTLLDSGDLVRPGGLVYVETARDAPLLHPGPGWDIARDKTLGEVRMVLLKKI